MVIRREAALEYVEDLKRRDTVVTDRKGKSLASGGDNDICLTALEHGWGVGYFPELELFYRKFWNQRFPHKRLIRQNITSLGSFLEFLETHTHQSHNNADQW